MATKKKPAAKKAAPKKAAPKKAAPKKAAPKLPVSSSGRSRSGSRLVRRREGGSDRRVSPPVARPGPALGLLEVGSIARGMVIADATVKKAAVNLLTAEPLTPGKFVVVITGGEEEVGQSLAIGLEIASETLIDRLELPKADAQIVPAMEGRVLRDGIDSIGVVETFSVASAVLAADRAVKAAEVKLLRLRLARGLGGKAFFVLSGELHQLEAAVEAARTVIHDGMLLASEIIARPHPDFLAAVL